MESSILPKNKRKAWKNYPKSSQDNFFSCFVRFFGRIQNSNFFFWDLLTFRKESNAKETKVLLFNLYTVIKGIKGKAIAVLLIWCLVYGKETLVLQNILWEIAKEWSLMLWHWPFKNTIPHLWWLWKTIYIRCELHIHFFHFWNISEIFGLIFLDIHILIMITQKIIRLKDQTCAPKSLVIFSCCLS